MKSIYFLLFMVLTISCSQNTNQSMNTDAVIELKISKKLYNKDTDYSKVIIPVEAIKLETNANSLFGTIHKMDFQNNRFYILDRSQVLFIFDEKGHFLNKLDKKGKGPGEYIEMRDFFVDKDGSIQILSYEKILSYDANLKFIKERAIHLTSNTGREINPVCFLPHGAFTFLFTGSFGLREIVQGKDHALYCMDNNNQIVGEDFPLTSKVSVGHQQFYRSNGLIYYTNTYGNDTIYQILDNKLVPKVAVNFQENKITEKDMMGNRDGIYSRVVENELCGNINRIYENNDYLCFHFPMGRDMKHGVYNKGTKEIKIFNVVKSLPFPYIMVDGMAGDSFFSILHPYNLLEETDDPGINEFKKTFNLTSLKETDNPVIVKFKYQF